MKRFFFAFIFPSVFVLTGIGILVWGMNERSKAVGSAEWPTVAGKVTASGMSSETSRGEPRSRSRARQRQTFAATVRFEYEVEGKSYTGDRISFDAGYRSGDVTKARAVVARYPEGKEVDVHYEPGNPENSVLEPGVPSTLWGLFTIGAIFFVVGLVGLVIMPRGIAAGWIHIR